MPTTHDLENANSASTDLKAFIRALGVSKFHAKKLEIASRDTRDVSVQQVFESNIIFPVLTKYIYKFSPCDCYDVFPRLASFKAFMLSIFCFFFDRLSQRARTDARLA